MSFTLNAHDSAILDALHRYMLRHPGVVGTRAAKAVRKLYAGETVTPEQLAELKLEYLKLGLGVKAGGA